MLNLFCYVIHYTLCETLNTRLDKLVMTAMQEKPFYCILKLTFLRKNAKPFVMALIKREILTSHPLHEVLHT